MKTKQITLCNKVQELENIIKALKRAFILSMEVDGEYDDRQDKRISSLESKLEALEKQTFRDTTDLARIADKHETKLEALEQWKKKHSK